MKFLLLALYLFFPSVDKSLCSCSIPESIKERDYENYNYIFEGEILTIDRGDLNNELLIRINTLYKGKKTAKVIRILTPAKSGFCGINAGEGDDWLIFAYLEGGNPITNICTRSKNLNPKNHMYNFQKKEINADLEFLRQKLQEEN